VKTVVVYTSNSSHEIYLKKAVLEEHNIPSFVSDENINNWFPHYSVAVGGVKLNVPVEFELKSRELILETEPKFYCPNCNSTKVVFNQFNSYFSVFLSLIAIIPFPFYKRPKYQCVSCKHKWNTQENGAT